MNKCLRIIIVATTNIAFGEEIPISYGENYFDAPEFDNLPWRKRKENPFDGDAALGMDEDGSLPILNADDSAHVAKRRATQRVWVPAGPRRSLRGRAS